MNHELRRSVRLSDFSPVSVFVINDETGKIVAGPFSGKIVDVSSYGACLLMTRVTLDSYHIFHSTRKDRTSSLLIKVNKPPELDEISIAAKPVWLNTFQKDDFLERLIGVEFLDTGNNTSNMNCKTEQ